MLGEPLSEQETLDAVAQAAAEALGGDSAAVLKSAGRRARARRRPRALGRTRRPSPREPGVAAWLRRSGKVLASSRLLEDDRFGEGLGRPRAARTARSLLAVPLQQPGGEGAGSRSSSSGASGRSTTTARAGAQVAGAARGALERSDLFERERRSRQLAQHLALAGRGLAGELDPDNVLDHAVRYAVSLLGADGASVRVLEGDEVVVARSRGPRASSIGARHAHASTAWLVGGHRPDAGNARRSPTAAAIRGSPTPTRCSPPATRATSACRWSGTDESVHGILAVYSTAAARVAGGGGRGAACARRDAAAAARANAELYQGVSHEQQRGEAILANVADGIVAVDREGRSCSGTRRRSA